MKLKTTKGYYSQLTETLANPVFNHETSQALSFPSMSCGITLHGMHLGTARSKPVALNLGLFVPQGTDIWQHLETFSMVRLGTAANLVSGDQGGCYTPYNVEDRRHSQESSGPKGQ